MERHTIVQRTKIVTMFLENNQSVVLRQRAYRQFYNVRTSRNTIYTAVRNFEERGTVVDARHTGRSRSGQSIKNIARVQSYRENKLFSLFCATLYLQESNCQ